MERADSSSPAERFLEVFEQGFNALWRRAHVTLGDVTLTAIVNRVLYQTAEKHPLLSSLTLDAAGLNTRELRQQVSHMDREALAAGMRFGLLELLTVIGNLTGEILTPALHAALCQEGPRS